MELNWWSDFLLASLRAATPLIYCAMAILLAERTGVLHIGVEGVMLIGALAGILGMVFGGHAWSGVLAAVASGALAGLLLGYISVYLPTDQVVVGIAFNLAAQGLTSYIFRLAGPKALELVSGVPTLIFKFNPFEVFAIVIAILVWWFLFATGSGLKIRSMGENAHAAEAAGMNVITTRIIIMVVAGVLSAIGGAALTMGWVRSFTDNVTMGRGFIALAAVYFGKWNPILATFAALLFGAGEALAFRAQASGAGLNAYYYFMVPYVLTILVIGLVGKAKGPADAGRPYIRG
ncbi:ABC transporter permease [Moorellaceae bacterium AZ2]